MDVQACTCSVCFELFADPRMLPCGHTYCQKCIEPLLEGARQKSAQCPTCRDKSKQPPKGFPVNYGMLDMVGQAQNMGTCSSCAKRAPMTDLFNCTTCKESSASATDAEIRVCGTCIAKTHKGHDYQEMDAASTAEIEKAHRMLGSYQNINHIESATLQERKGIISAAIGELEKMFDERAASLATVDEDVNISNAPSKAQLAEKEQQVEQMMENKDIAAALEALDKCRWKLVKIKSLQSAINNAGIKSYTVAKSGSIIFLTTTPTPSPEPPVAAQSPRRTSPKSGASAKRKRLNFDDSGDE